MQIDQNEKNPFHEFIEKSFVLAMKGMIEQVKQEKIFSPEFEIYKTIIISGIAYYESKYNKTGWKYKDEN